MSPLVINISEETGGELVSSPRRTLDGAGAVVIAAASSAEKEAGSASSGGEGRLTAEERMWEYFASDPYKHFTTVKGEKAFPNVKQKLKMPEQFQVRNSASAGAK